MLIRSRFLPFVLGMTVVAFAFLGIQASASAATIVVAQGGSQTGAPTPAGDCVNPNYNTIQAAIDASSDLDLISVCPGTYTDGPWTVTDKNLTFQGAGDGTDPAQDTIINGGGVRDGFRIATTTTSGTPVPLSASFTGFRFVNNVAPSDSGAVGGSAIRPVGIYVDLALTVIDSYFSGNSTPNGTEDDGGAISASTVIATGSTFTSNRADDDGGALEANTSATITNSTFTSNDSESGDGGAIQAPTVDVTDSTFTSNESEASTSDQGGAIDAPTAVTVSGSTFVNNSVGRTPASNLSDGGAISTTSIDISDSTFIGNESGDIGGAIDAADGVDGVDIENSIFKGNVSKIDGVNEGAGGALNFGDGSGDPPAMELEIVDSTFGGPGVGDGNSAHYGGAILSRGATIIRTSEDPGATSVFEGNSSIENGGAIRCTGVCPSFQIDSTLFRSNTTTLGGGAIGKGTTVPSSVPLTVTDSSFESNQATANGGAIRWSLGTVNLTRSTFTGNLGGQSVVSADRPINIDRSTFQGTQTNASPFVYAEDNVTVEDSTFFSNNAVSGFAAGIVIPSTVNEKDLTVSDSTFTGLAAACSSAIYNGADGLATDTVITNSTLTGNSVSGGMCSPGHIVSEGTLSLLSSTVAGNETQDADLVSFDGMTIGNSILDGDPELLMGTSCAFAQGTPTNLGGNVISDQTLGCEEFVGGPVPSPGTKVPLASIALQPLADNGGPTQTMALGVTSVARSSAGTNLLGPSPKDQRGLERPATDQSSGAYQLITRQLTVEKAGGGSGTVTSSPAGIDCGPACAAQSASFAQNPPFNTVTLTAGAASGSTFTGWSGSGCSGTGTCEVTMDEARSVTATFTEDVPSGKPKIKVSIKAPKKVKAGKRFTIRVKTTNGAKDQTIRSTRAVEPTTATKVKTCTTLPRGLFVVNPRGGKVSGRRVCWTGSSLTAGKSVNYSMVVRSSSTASGSERISASASASNSSGATAKATAKSTVKVVKPKPRPKPKPPTG